ncbi:hypothetical protein SDC9_47801 [bioreactor metagenome]|uniref:Purine catabolism regulatory protein n=1 Tax=bioreactor metagenome TaxID=1076179 RepID=A0A644WDK7_9ZZZZ
MSAKLGELLNSKQLDCIHVAAGEKGLSHDVVWINTIESPDLIKFVNQSELVFSTGVEIKQDNEKLLRLIRGSHEAGAAGNVINLGPYIHSIPPEITGYAQRNNYPILTIPWEIRLADITQIICNYLIQNQGTSKTRDLFFNLLVLRDSTADIISKLSSDGFSKDFSYGVVVIDGADESSPLALSMSSKLIYSFYKYFAFKMNGQLVYVVVRRTDTNFCYGGIIKEMIHDWIPGLKKDGISIGIGNFYGDLSLLHRSFQEARLTVRLIKVNQGERCVEFCALGIYKTLLHLDGNAELLKSCRELFQPLEEYDKINSTNYMDLLRVYLNNDASIVKTSQKLYIHKNTAVYKINKIEELLGCRLSSLRVKSELMTALLLYDVLSPELNQT